MNAAPLIVLVTAEPAGHRGAARALQDAGFDIRFAHGFADAAQLATASVPALLLLDSAVAAGRAADVIRRLGALAAAPVMVLAHNATADERAALLNAGADDVLSAPYSAQLLVARIGAILRRAPVAVRAASLLRIGPLELDLDRRSARVAGRSLRLTPREWDLLVLLARRAGRIVTRQELLMAIWGMNHARDWHYLRVHMTHLRQKLGQAADLLQTERGVGFRLGDMP